MMLKIQRYNWKTILLLIRKSSRIKQKNVTTEISEFQEDNEIIINAAVFLLKTLNHTLC